MKEQESDAAVDINGMGFSVKYSKYVIVIDSDYNINEPFDTEEWDNKAAPENVFIWESNDQNDEGYGVVIGYTANADNYTTLRFPSRCTKITFANDLNYEGIDTATSRAFTDNILKVEIPSTVKIIGDYAFGEPRDKSFQNLKEVVIEEGVTSIGDLAFIYCINLRDIEIPNSVANIGRYAFCCCSSLKSIEITKSITSIEDSTFDGCTGLTSIIIPESVINIGGYAFGHPYLTAGFSDTLVYNVVQGSYADTWVQTNKYGNQTINYIN